MNNGNLDKKIRFNFERLKQLLEENSNLKILYNSPFYAELVQENTRIEEYLEKTKKDVGTDDIDTNLIRKNAMRMLFDNPVQLVHLKFKKNILSLILEKFF
jgi:hypothetical protein